MPGRAVYADAMSVHVESTGPVTTVVIDRPERRNAVDRATAEALASVFREFDADASQSVAVLTGSGGTFCAGADLTTMDNRVEPDGDGPMGPTRMRMSKPVIAAVEGYAVAGGLELAIWCDLRVASEEATFGVFCRRWGVPLIDGGTVRLPRLVGAGRAMDLVLSGRSVGAAEAERIGLVNRVVPAGHALSEAQAWAAELAELPQECLRNDRRSLLDQEGLDEAAAMQREHELGTFSLLAAADGVRRFRDGAGRHGS
jgi:enoyl-CoA hydratase